MTGSYKIKLFLWCAVIIVGFGGMTFANKDDVLDKSHLTISTTNVKVGG